MRAPLNVHLDLLADIFEGSPRRSQDEADVILSEPVAWVVGDILHAWLNVNIVILKSKNLKHARNSLERDLGLIHLRPLLKGIGYNKPV